MSNNFYQLTPNLLLLISKYQVKNTRFQIYEQQYFAEIKALQKTD